jgi:hypothetical protein
MLHSYGISMIIYGTSGDINLAILYGTSETSDAFFCDQLLEAADMRHLRAVSRNIWNAEQRCL